MYPLTVEGSVDATPQYGVDPVFVSSCVLTADDHVGVDPSSVHRHELSLGLYPGCRHGETFRVGHSQAPQNDPADHSLLEREDNHIRV